MTETLPRAASAPPSPAREAHLRALLRPRSIAVVGASAKEGSPAYRTLRNLVDSDFDGAVHPVNPKRSELLGLPCHASLGDIEGPVDMALVMVPAAQVESVIEDCGAIGVEVAVLFSSGFAELGEDGRAMQRRLGAVARRAGVRLLGPNCQGLAFAPHQLTATFSVPAADLGNPSGIAYIGQSGALGGALVYECRSRGIGLSAWISTGNQTDLTVTDAAMALLAEPTISVLGIYLEEMPDGGAWQELVDVASEAGKRVVVLRSGRTESGKHAAASHTGAMIDRDASFTALSRRGGVVAVEDLDEMVDVFAALLDPRAGRGERVGIVTSSGGAGGIMVDHLEEHGLRVAELDESTIRSLARVVPAFGSITNPVDVTTELFTTDNDDFATVCRHVCADSGVDHLVVLLTGLNAERAGRLAEEIAGVADGADTPMSFVHMAAPDGRAAVDRTLHRHAVGVFNSMRDMAVAHGRIRRSANLAGPGRQPASGEPVSTAVTMLDGVTGSVTEWSGRGLLGALDIDVPDAHLITAAGGRTEVSDDGTFALKVQSPDITHKTDVGGVQTSVPAPDVADVARSMLRRIGESVPDARIEGIMAQRMADPGIQLLIGVEGSTGGYPPLITVGSGGSHTEIYADIESATCPLDEAGALALLRGTAVWKLLDGFRGAPSSDVDTVIRTLVALSRLAAELGDRLVNLEINPYIVRERGATAVDLVLRLREPGTSEEDVTG